MRLIVQTAAKNRQSLLHRGTLPQQRRRLPGNGSNRRRQNSGCRNGWFYDWGERRVAGRKQKSLPVGLGRLSWELLKWSYRDSNPNQQNRNLSCYPLHHKTLASVRIEANLAVFPEFENTRGKFCQLPPHSPSSSRRRDASRLYGLSRVEPGIHLRRWAYDSPYSTPPPFSASFSVWQRLTKRFWYSVAVLPAT